MRIWKSLKIIVILNGVDGYLPLENMFKNTLNPFFTSKDIKMINKKMAENKDDTTFYKFGNFRDNTDELLPQEMLDSRMISEDELKLLARSTLILKRGEKYAKLPIEQMRKEVEESRQWDSNTRSEIDSKYGIDWYDKSEIFKIMDMKDKVKKLVGDKSAKDLQEFKAKFESMRNFPSVQYSSRKDEMKFILKELFNDKIDDVTLIDMEFKMPNAFIEEAISERQVELENNKNKSKGIFAGLFDKIKNIFSKNKQKALPTGQDTDDKALKTNSSKAYRDEMGGYGSSIDYTKISNQNDRGQTQKNNEFNGR